MSFVRKTYNDRCKNNSIYVCICCMRVWLVTQLCPTLGDPMDCSPPGSSVHGIFQARILEWMAIPFSRGSSWPRGRAHVSRTGRQILYYCTTWEAPYVCMGTNTFFLSLLHLEGLKTIKPQSSKHITQTVGSKHQSFLGEVIGSRVGRVKVQK